MATVVNGTNLRIYASGIAIGEATNCTMSLSVESREILTKDNVGSYTRNLPGRRSGTLQSEGLVAYDTTNLGVDDLFTHFDSGTILIVRFTTDATGTPYWEASAFISNLEFAAQVEENATYSATWTVTGAVTTGTES